MQFSQKFSDKKKLYLFYFILNNGRHLIIKLLATTMALVIEHPLGSHHYS